MTLFTVQLEVGPETRAMIERIARGAAMELELGPHTRETIERLATALGMPKRATTVEPIEGLLGKSADARSSD